MSFRSNQYGNRFDFSFWPLVVGEHDLQPVESLVMLFLMHNDKAGNGYGLFQMTAREIAFGANIPRADAESAVVKLKVLGLIFEDAGLVFVPLILSEQQTEKDRYQKQNLRKLLREFRNAQSMISGAENAAVRAFRNYYAAGMLNAPGELDEAENTNEMIAETPQNSDETYENPAGFARPPDENSQDENSHDFAQLHNDSHDFTQTHTNSHNQNGYLAKISHAE